MPQEIETMPGLSGNVFVTIKPAGKILLGGALLFTLFSVARLYLQSSRDLSAPPVTRVRAEFPVSRRSRDGLTRQKGVTGAYYANAYLNGTPAFVRTDTKARFLWGRSSPGDPLGTEQFSVRWEGEVTPVINGTHTFYLRVDDGARLWVNNKLVVDLWRPTTKDRVTSGFSNEPVAAGQGVIWLTAGKPVPIRVDYYQVIKSSQMELLWSYPGQPQQYLPISALSPKKRHGKP